MVLFCCLRIIFAGCKLVYCTSGRLSGDTAKFLVVEDRERRLMEKWCRSFRTSHRQMPPSNYNACRSCMWNKVSGLRLVMTVPIAEGSAK
ncbi:hypothetical protein B0H63DRAFT_489916 [Podospora didyma]|uniref:Secreted protein n=1 Tax=Podospora didyma TaxID=330526 RepID=A0AAE0K0Q2_9PEZI|nr:hypothetical protein B0H63DRAFT_489916 [Podospora didyma]